MADFSKEYDSINWTDNMPPAIQASNLKQHEDSFIELYSRTQYIYGHMVDQNTYKGLYALTVAVKNDAQYNANVAERSRRLASASEENAKASEIAASDAAASAKTSEENAKASEDAANDILSKIHGIESEAIAAEQRVISKASEIEEAETTAIQMAAEATASAAAAASSANSIGDVESSVSHMRDQTEIYYMNTGALVERAEGDANRAKQYSEESQRFANAASDLKGLMDLKADQVSKDAKDAVSACAKAEESEYNARMSQIGALNNEQQSQEYRDQSKKYCEDAEMYAGFAEQYGNNDYSNLINKPQINGVELDGNKTSEELGLKAGTGLDDWKADGVYKYGSVVSHNDKSWKCIHNGAYPMSPDEPSATNPSWEETTLTETVADLFDASNILTTENANWNNVEVSGGGKSSVTSILSAIVSKIKEIIRSIPGESTVSGWGFTKNAGTITGIKMNNASKGTSGVVDLGTVITSHQDISGKANTSVISDAYNANTTYAVGQYCIYNNSLWRCKTQCKGQTPAENSYWTKRNLGQEIKQINTDLSAINSNLSDIRSGKIGMNQSNWTNSGLNNIYTYRVNFSKPMKAKPSVLLTRSHNSNQYEYGMISTELQVCDISVNGFTIQCFASTWLNDFNIEWIAIAI